MPQIWSSGDQYYSVAETATLVRAALRRAFPGIRFGVTSNVYSGGGSVIVRIPAGGPPPADVHAVVSMYAGGDFDGSIDMTWSRVLYLDDAGIVRGWDDPGQGRHDPQPAGTHRARMGARYIFVES